MGLVVTVVSEDYDEVLAWINETRWRLGLGAVSKIEDGMPVKDNDCPIARTLTAGLEEGAFRVMVTSERVSVGAVNAEVPEGDDRRWDGLAVEIEAAEIPHTVRCLLYRIDALACDRTNCPEPVEEHMVHVERRPLTSRRC